MRKHVLKIIYLLLCLSLFFPFTYGVKTTTYQVETISGWSFLMANPIILACLAGLIVASIFVYQRSRTGSIFLGLGIGILLFILVSSPLWSLETVSIQALIQLPVTYYLSSGLMLVVYGMTLYHVIHKSVNRTV